MRKSLIITVVIALLCLCGCEAVVTVSESPEPTKAKVALFGQSLQAFTELYKPLATRCSCCFLWWAL